MRKILVGQQPGTYNPPSKPLWAGHSRSTGYRIAMLSGLEAEDYHELFERVNINHLSDITFSVNDVTKERGRRVRETFRQGDVVIALGKSVCEALGLPVPEDYFTLRRVKDKGFMYAVIPHPSGLNRFYNDKGNYQDAEDFMRAVVAYPDEYVPEEHPWNNPPPDEEEEASA